MSHADMSNSLGMDREGTDMTRELRSETFNNIQRMYKARDDIVHNRLSKIHDYVALQRDLTEIGKSSEKEGGETSFKTLQFVRKFSRVVEELQYLDD